jgi:glutathione S-transferase
MKLYYAPGACSLASHIVLREVDVPFEMERVDTKTKQTEHGHDFFAVNPKGSVPALAFDGEVLTEGVAIMQYVADRNGATTLAPPAGTLARARVQEMLNFVSAELHKSFSPLFAPNKTEEELAALRAVVAKKLDWLETTLSDGRAYLTGNDFTVADAYAFVVTNWAAFKNIDLSPWPKLQAMRTRIAERPATIAAMKAEGLI